MDRILPVHASTLAGDPVRIRAPLATSVTDTRCNLYAKNGDYWEAANALPLLTGVDAFTITEPDAAGTR